MNWSTRVSILVSTALSSIIPLPCRPYIPVVRTKIAASWYGHNLGEMHSNIEIMLQEHSRTLPVDPSNVQGTVEPVVRDHLFCAAKAVSQDRWSLITGIQVIFYACIYMSLKTVVQDEWSLITGIRVIFYPCIGLHVFENGRPRRVVAHDRVRTRQVLLISKRSGTFGHPYEP